VCVGFFICNIFCSRVMCVCLFVYVLHVCVCYAWACAGSVCACVCAWACVWGVLFIQMPFAGEIVYYTCFVADSVNSDLSQFFDEAYDFIEKARVESPKNNVLVHCAGAEERMFVCVFMFM